MGLEEFIKCALCGWKNHPASIQKHGVCCWCGEKWREKITDAVTILKNRYPPQFVQLEVWLKNTIVSRLEAFNGSVTKTYISLGISKATLYLKMKRFGIVPARYRRRARK